VHHPTYIAVANCFLLVRCLPDSRRESCFSHLARNSPSRPLLANRARRSVCMHAGARVAKGASWPSARPAWTATVPGDARPHRSVCGEVHGLSGAVVVALQLHASAVLRRADHGQRPERGTSKVARDRALTHGALLTRFDAQRARSGAASARADAWMHALRSTSLRYQCRGWSLV